MNTVQVKNTVIGEGRPKICVPIVGKTKTDILEEAKRSLLFRLMWLSGVLTGSMMSLLLKSIRNRKRASGSLKRYPCSPYIPYFQRRRGKRDLCK